MESAQINQAQLKQIDAFQLKCFRTILHLETIFFNRASSNDAVFQRVYQTIRDQGGRGNIVLASESCASARRVGLTRRRSPEKSYVRNQNDSTDDFGKRRVGKPKTRWADEVLREYWAKIQHVLFGQIRGPSWRSGGGRIGLLYWMRQGKWFTLD